MMVHSRETGVDKGENTLIHQLRCPFSLRRRLRSAITSRSAHSRASSAETREKEASRVLAPGQALACLFLGWETSVLDGVMGQIETNLPAGGEVGRPSN
jgi:hypothetical protein